MKLDLIDPVPVPVVRAQHGGVDVGLPGQLGCISRAGQGAEFMQLRQNRLAAMGLDSGQQSLIGRYVMPGKQWYLILDFMRLPEQCLPNQV